MLFQPLEQFKPNIISCLLLSSEYYLTTLYYSIYNKYSIIHIILLTTILFFIFFTAINKKIKIFNLFQIIYNRIMLEMINVVSFNFIFSATLYFSVFLYIYIYNIVGLLPNTPCWTTQIYANLTLSFRLILGITILNIDKNGSLFFQLFIPKDVPKILIPFLSTPEFLSHFIRILSLSIRLFSNMVAGHSLLHILFDMILNIKYVIEVKLDVFFFIFIAPISVLLVIVFFEFIVAFLQAYVFAIMFTIYLNDLNLQH